MSEQPATYRWNTREAAEAFDAAAQHIHPYYLAVQEELLHNLPFERDASFLIVDLGGGSGRLIERVLRHFPNGRAVVVDQSEVFLELAKQRLAEFGDRARLVRRRLQEDWQAELEEPPGALVSASAIHHLDPSEKRALFARCYKVLAPEGVFLNGDEYRPETDAEYLAMLERWNEHKNAASAAGLIPRSFDAMFDAWYDRNIRRFGEARRSGDDCHETIDAQLESLRAAGFRVAEVVWAKELWGVVKALR